MPRLDFDAENGLHYIHHEPTAEGAATFVFVNALTGSTDAWEAAVAPRLREQGHGTLSYNLRGQTGSPFDPALTLDDTLIVGDLRALLDAIEPARPVLVGLSIGGLYAARAVLGGAEAKGLVLLNTLREIGPRIAWVNEAMPLLVAHGGVKLFLDALFPLLVGQEMAARSHGDFLKGGYEPLDPDHGHMNLMRAARTTDWTVDWPALTLPVLTVTGLEDRVFLDREVVDRLFAQIPDARREDWEDAGHLLPAERPERLAGSLARFADAIGLGGRA